MRRGTWACICMLLGVLGARALGLRVNLSESLPLGLYQTGDLGTLIETGELVCFDVDHASAPEAAKVSRASGVPLLKRVVATAGARVDRDRVSGTLIVDGLPVPCSAPVLSASYGTELPHLELPTVVPVGSVWLMSMHPRGFDSRYFGAVPVSALVCGRARALWTWGGREQC